MVIIIKNCIIKSLFIIESSLEVTEKSEDVVSKSDENVKINSLGIK